MLELPRGEQGKFLREMKELIRVCSPVMVILLEPKTSGSSADVICNNLAMRYWGRLEAIGYSGGIWVLWLDAAWEVVIKHVHKMFIHLSVCLGDGAQWDLTAVYANPHAIRRKGL